MYVNYDVIHMFGLMYAGWCWTAPVLFLTPNHSARKGKERTKETHCLLPSLLRAGNKACKVLACLNLILPKAFQVSG